MISTLTHEDSLNAVEGPPANAHSLPHTNEGVHGAWDLFPKRGLQVLDLFIRDRGPLPLTAHEPKHPWRPQYLQPLFDRLHDTNKGIAAKHGNFPLAPTVAQARACVDKRKKRAHALFLKLRSCPLFMPRHRVNRIPF